MSSTPDVCRVRIEGAAKKFLSSANIFSHFSSQTQSLCDFFNNLKNGISFFAILDKN